MSDRKNTPFTNEHFAAFCGQMVGQPYWFGTCGSGTRIPLRIF